MNREGANNPWAVELYGYGQVGRALVPLLRRNGWLLASVHDRKGIRRRRPVGNARRVVVDATSPAYTGDAAERWVLHLEQILAGGTPVVTCNKAPLALSWSRLARAAQRGGTTLSCAATVGGGTPVLLFLERLQQSHGVERVDAWLNITLGFLCAQIAQGASLSNALRRAQEAGWAEPDPTLDLNGTDLYAKGVIIHNLLFSSQPPLTLIGDRPLLRLDENALRQRSRHGGVPQVRCTITPGRVRLSIDATYPLASAKTGFAEVRAALCGGGEAWVSGPGAGPRVTAQALIGDLKALAGAGPIRLGAVIP